MNSKIKQNLEYMVSCDKYELPLTVFKDLKGEMIDCVSKFVRVENEDVKMNVKVLKNGKFVIDFQILSDNLIV